MTAAMRARKEGERRRGEQAIQRNRWGDNQPPVTGKIYVPAETVRRPFLFQAILSQAFRSLSSGATTCMQPRTHSEAKVAKPLLPCSEFKRADAVLLSCLSTDDESTLDVLTGVAEEATCRSAKFAGSAVELTDRGVDASLRLAAGRRNRRLEIAARCDIRYPDCADVNEGRVTISKASRSIGKRRQRRSVACESVDCCFLYQSCEIVETLYDRLEQTKIIC